MRTYTILGIPKPQGRARHRVVKTKDGKIFGQTYDPMESAQYKSNIAAQVVAQDPELIPARIPIRMDVLYYLPRPKSHYNTKGQVKGNAPTYCVTKPDRDNLDKSLKDSLRGITWIDDCQVCAGETQKMYGETPKVVIQISRLD
jgi:Holliday junction resolvase RusA-like endonuclease